MSRVMCHRLSCLEGALPVHAYAPERFGCIEFDDQENQRINRGDQFEVLPDAHERTLYKDHESLCPSHFHGNYNLRSESARIASNGKLFMYPVGWVVSYIQSQKWLNQFQRR